MALTIPLNDCITASLALALDLNQNHPIIVTLDFAKKKFFDDVSPPGLIDDCLLINRLFPFSAGQKKFFWNSISYQTDCWRLY